MAKKLVHYSFSIIALLLSFSLLFFQVVSGRPLAAPMPHTIGLHKTHSDEAKPMNLSENFKIGKPRGNDARKLGVAFGPYLMHMLPKGKIPVSGPSRRINDAKN